MIACVTSEGIRKVLQRPQLHRVQARRPSTGLELRSRNAAQFAIVYAYIEPSDILPSGIVSIRAIRHRRAKNIFTGVREPSSPPYISLPLLNGQ